MTLYSFLRVFGAVMILIFFVCGLDDTLWSIAALCSRLYRHLAREDALDFNDLRSTPPKLLAVSIAAWHEANVIGDVINNFLNTTDYPKSMYHLFVGVYPNDPETIAAVEAAAERFPNVHPVVNCKEGPTTKAQNLNHVIRQIRVYEQEHGLRFAALTIHDSEDVVHTYELLATNYLIDRYDALQFPVFPIMKLPTFKNFFPQLTTATYADEFAENHFTTLVQRRTMGAFVPCAGTGFALSRKLLETYRDEDVLPTESLTEDYMLSLQLYKKGFALHYVLDRIPRVMKNGRIRQDFITTRSLFPGTFRAAVRQKTRWTYGITMQSVGLRDVFRSKGVSLAGRYTFYKDTKTKVVNLIPALAYVTSVYGILALIFGLAPLYTRDSPLFPISLAVFAMMCVRQFTRGYALFHVYGMRSVFFGCLLPPFFPIRLIYGNIINFVATLGALRMKLSGGRRRKRRERQTDRKTVRAEKKARPAWAKTDHEFLSREQLRQYRRMLGDMLIVQGYLTAKQFNDALAQVDKAHGEQIGAYLVRAGVITEEQMIQALGHVKHVIFIPNGVAERLDCQSVLSSFDRTKLEEAKILPLTRENGVYVIGVCDGTRDADVEAFAGEYGPVRRMYMMEPQIEMTLRGTAGKGKPLSSLSLYDRGELSFEQVVLIATYAQLLDRPEQAVRHYMGL